MPHFLHLLVIRAGNPKGRSLPLAFGIYTLRTGLGSHLFSLRSSRIFAARWSEYPSMVSPSTPAVILPGLG